MGDMHGGQSDLLGRLRDGQAWLTAVYDRLLALPNAGIDAPDELRFLRGLDLWDRLEQCLRAVYHFESCAMPG